MAWAWVCRYAVRSSRVMAGVSGLRGGNPTGPFFTSFCRASRRNGGNGNILQTSRESVFRARPTGQKRRESDKLFEVSRTDAPSGGHPWQRHASESQSLSDAKHLAASLAKEHHLTKKAGQVFLNDLVCLITKHLEKRCTHPNLRVLASCKSGNARLAWDAIPRPARRSRSKRAKRSPSGRARN